MYLSNYYFDNQEGGIEGNKFSSMYVSKSKYDTIENSFKNEVLELSKDNKIILIYPIPAVGWDPNKKIWLSRKNKFSKTFNLTEITTSYEVYKNRTKLSFELLDSIENDNVYRVFPHRLFCNTAAKNRCMAHDDKDIFYSDDDHPSYKGAEMINELIMQEIERIEN